jgi:hypothetical protein
LITPADLLSQGLLAGGERTGVRSGAVGPEQARPLLETAGENRNNTEPPALARDLRGRDAAAALLPRRIAGECCEDVQVPECNLLSPSLG